MSRENYDLQLKKFFKAALENDIEVLKQMLDKGYRINRGDGDLYTALHRVCEHWSSDTSDTDGVSASSDNTAKFLVANGADVNADNPATDGWTPLHLSCWAGRVGAVKFLIRNGARINYPDWYGATPKDIAAYAGHHDIVNLIAGMENKNARL